MAFEGLSEKLQHVYFRKLTNRGKLTEVEVKAAMREVKLVLLEADVNFKVGKKFHSRALRKELSGEEVMKEPNTPGQQVIKIVRDELVHTFLAIKASKP